MRTLAQKQNPPQEQASSKFARRKRVILRTNHHPSPLLHVPRTIGNQAVQRVVQTNAEDLKAGLAGTASPRFGQDSSRISMHPPAAGAIQTKLALNQPGDIYEQEADRVSEQVMNMSAPQLQRTYPCGGECPKGQTEQPSRKDERLPTKLIGSSGLRETAVPPIVHEVLHSPGQPLDPAVRVFMEPRFGHDFSKLRVHLDAKAAESAQALGAAAYTAGNDIVFRAGEFNPQTSDGRRLIAHELAHVVQEGKGSRNVQHIRRQPRGRIVRVEHTGRFSRRPPGPGAYTQAELDSWYERHPKATSAGGANLVDGERTKDRAFAPEELWKRGYYYAKITVSEDMHQAWESWLNDEGDGKVITIFVRFTK